MSNRQDPFVPDPTSDRPWTAAPTGPAPASDQIWTAPDQPSAPGTAPEPGPFPPAGDATFPFPVTGQSPYGSPPVTPPRKSRRGLFTVLAIVGCLLVAGAAVLGTLVVRAASEETEPSSAPIVQQTTEAPAGGTQIVAAEDGLALTLPEDWEQIPTSPKEIAAWSKEAAELNPGFAKIIESSQSNQMLNNLTAFAAYQGAQATEDIEYMVVVRSPMAIPEITEDAVSQIAKPMSEQPMMKEVSAELATVAGTPAARISATMKIKNSESRPLTNHLTMYVVSAEQAGGFFVYFNSTQPGDPRGDIQKIMDSFDPAYAG